MTQSDKKFLRRSLVALAVVLVAYAWGNWMIDGKFLPW